MPRAFVAVLIVFGLAIPTKAEARHYPRHRLYHPIDHRKVDFIPHHFADMSWVGIASIVDDEECGICWKANKLNRDLKVTTHGSLADAELPDGQMITVAAVAVEKFVDFLSDLFLQENKLPEIGCYASGGHIPRSFHYRGLACDVGQDRRNVAWKPMYHVGDLAKQHGIDDGCRFGDCGHISIGEITGQPAAAASTKKRVHYARHRVRMATR